MSKGKKKSVAEGKKSAEKKSAAVSKTSGKREKASAPAAPKKRGKPGNPRADRDDQRVRLKPRFGMQPRTYLPIIYSVLILIIIFVVLILPGIIKYGSYVKLETRPSVTEVFVNGTRVDAVDGQEIFVPAGMARIRIDNPFFQSLSIEKQIPGRIFASIFFPKRITVQAEMNIDDPQGYLKHMLKEYGMWAAAGQSTDRYRVPLVAQEWARSLREISGSNYNEIIGLDRPDAVDQILLSLMGHISSETQLKDTALTTSILTSPGNIWSGLSIERGLRKLASLASERKNLLFLMRPALNAAENAEPETRGWFSDFMSHYQTEVLSAWGSRSVQPNGFRSNTDDSYPERLVLAASGDFSRADGGGAAAAVTGGGSSPSGQQTVFHLIPAGTFLVGSEISETQRTGLEPPYPVEVPAFYIAENEVTNRNYYRFVRENPRWSPENRGALIDEGLVDADYLSAWENNMPPARILDHPVTGVSWYGAAAYCSWLEESIEPRSLSNIGSTSLQEIGLHLRLPGENEWEWAAHYAEQKELSGYESSIFLKPNRKGPVSVRYLESKQIRAGTESPGIYHMRGNVWEWCENWYAPAAYTLASWAPGKNTRPTNMFSGFARSVRGGAWINRAEEITTSTRGSQPPHFCSPYLGFRPMLSILE
ncbi:MAG: formylglycine-generating enzyme family protein [Spirochaetales bacterium]|nr:formylglycine-generating enzyme family protein [Spirochaetales bacterium]